MNTKTSRRNLIKKIAAGSVAAAVSHPFLALASENMEDIKLKGNINHSVCQWTYGFMPLEELCAEVKKMGMKAVDLLAPKDWPTLEKYGLVCSMCYIAGKVSLTEGWNNTKFHDQLIKDCALQVDFRKLATLFGTQLIEMPEALHALNRSCNWPATALERACCFSTQDGR